MPFCDLETMSLRDYVAREQAKVEGLWFFLHIPKTAGSSFSTELPNHLIPYRNVEVDYTDHSRSFDDKLVHALEVFVSDMNWTSYRSASGHLPWELTSRLLHAHPSTRVISFLRDPVARVVSEYRYQRTPVHPDYHAFCARFDSLKSYVQWSGSQNQMTHFLFGSGHVPSPDELIQHLGRNFTMLGLVEMYPLSFHAIFSCMGYPDLAPTEFQRRTSDTKDNKVDLTPDMVAMILEANHLDVAAYNYVRDVLIPHRDVWRGKTVQD